MSRSKDDGIPVFKADRAIVPAGCITADFDNTVLEHTGLYDSVPFFRFLSKVFDLVVVTSRIVNVEEIVDFCVQNDIKATAIIYDAGTKTDILSQIRPLCHFDDDRSTAERCIKAGIPVFLAGAGDSYKKELKQALKKKKIWKWYILNKLRMMLGI